MNLNFLIAPVRSFFHQKSLHNFVFVDQKVQEISFNTAKNMTITDSPYRFVLNASDCIVILT